MCRFDTSLHASYTSSYIIILHTSHKWTIIIRMNFFSWAQKKLDSFFRYIFLYIILVFKVVFAKKENIKNFVRSSRSKSFFFVFFVNAIVRKFILHELQKLCVCVCRMWRRFEFLRMNVLRKLIRWNKRMSQIWSL